MEKKNKSIRVYLGKYNMDNEPIFLIHQNGSRVEIIRLA